MIFTQTQKENHIKKLKESIVNLQGIEKILVKKNPNHSFLYSVIGNAGSGMIELLLYLEGKNPYYNQFDDKFYNNRQATMHRVFFGDLHVAVEEGLRKIITEQKLTIITSKVLMANNIVNKISSKLSDMTAIKHELTEIKKLASNHPTFNDYLNTVLNHIKRLSNKYKKASRVYFDGLSIIRNKVSHSDMSLTDIEKQKLKNAKLGNAISKDGLLQMTFEGYKFLVGDVIRFFDTLYANL